jgi:hypothetical protein
LTPRESRCYPPRVVRRGPRQYCVWFGILAVVALPTACSSETNWSGEVAVADQAVFNRDVYPVLLADCAYSQCHGAEQRFFRVFGPGRTRLKDASGSSSSALEMQASYVRALSMLITDGSRPLIESPLLIKPLDVAAGGSAHGGNDNFGHNVYRSASDPGYALIKGWALGAQLPTAPIGVAGMAATGGNSALIPSGGTGALNLSVPPPAQEPAGAAAFPIAGAAP